MARSKTIDLGRGFYEDLTLKVWVAKRDGDSRRFAARVTGTVPVYCGNGGRHDTLIDERLSAWQWPGGGEVDAGLLAGAWAGDEQTERDLADQMTEWALDGWSDPCDDDGDIEIGGIRPSDVR